MSGICYIIGAGEHFENDVFTPDDNDIVIAADGGYIFCREKNIRTDIIIGDFDSLNMIPEISEDKNEKMIRLNPVKDETDMFCAINYGIEHDYKIFRIYGGTGGRTDHTVANIQSLVSLARRGMKGYIFSKNEIMTAICNGRIDFDSSFSGYVSAFSLDSECRDVNERGLKYRLDGYTMKNDFPIGVSNEFIGKESSISVGNGTLLIIYQRK